MIVSIDDLAFVCGAINFPFIARMVSLFLERELPVVVAIVTGPLLQGASGYPVQLTDQGATVGGRDSLSPVAGTEPPVCFVGRVGPLTGNFRSIYSAVAHWQVANERACADPAIP